MLSAYIILIVTVVVVVVLVLIYLYAIPAGEKFGELKSSKQNGQMSVTGTVEKYHNNGEYIYTYLYNLPITNPPFQLVDSKISFNEAFETQDYKVYLGHSKDKLGHVGILTRFSDGFHKFTYKSDQDYHYSCIALGDSTIDCSEF